MSSDEEARVVRVQELPGGENSETFDGHAHGAQVSFFLSHNRPRSGPKLHRHPHEEIFIVQEGEVRFTAGDHTIEGRSGDIVVVPAGMPHRFVSHGGTHRQISIHRRSHGDGVARVRG